MSGRDFELQGYSDSVAALVARVAGRVVAVNARDGRGSSGILLRPGVIVTAEETVERDADIVIGLPDGSEVAATLAGADPSTDIAVLRIDGGPAVTALEPASAVPPGALAFAIGRGAAGVLAASGVVAASGGPWRSLQGGTIDALVRADLRLSGEAEGGALVDASGRLIGMAVFGPRRRVLAIPTATIGRVADRILAGGSFGRGYLGAGLQPVEVDGAGAAMVVTVDPDGPAKAAGLILGDIMRTWNGETVAGPRAIVERLGPDTVGTKVAIGASRAGQPVSLTVTIGTRPKG